MDPRDENDNAHLDYSDDEHEGLAGTRSTVTSFPKGPSLEPVESSLGEAIDTAPDIELRALLKELDDTEVLGDEFGPIPDPDDEGSNEWYNWTCCGAEGDETGYAVGGHVPISSEAEKRTRE